MINSSMVKGSVGDRDLRTAKNAPYQAYLIRCWYEDGNWRFALETIGEDGCQRGFTSLVKLTAYIQSKLDDASRLLLSSP